MLATSMLTKVLGPENDPFDDTPRVCQKLIYLLGLTLGGQFDRKNESSNERFLGMRKGVLFTQKSRCQPKNSTRAKHRRGLQSPDRN
jgi:hypothetical protein